ncbi:diguanylate cyclase (GGDEF)-like protein [Bacillus niacini]|uniref:Diguanylate cyclase (GGDEF)-like protein n=1 Tax=Neobacillus niacini TaxID=86668 RepID=A0A852TIN5_9BACI|nr:GGDEF domain-containing protein [Neobacillus niacini]NYE08632.1 diguanylate cyclase (GGDEF)-like protein [Neobacillus niacini]
MVKRFESLNGLKIRIYLWVIPCIVISLISNTLLQNVEGVTKFDFTINNILSIWFIISWFFLYKRIFIQFMEYSNLALVSYYHVTTFFDAVRNYMVVDGGSLGDFIIWMPIITLFFFLTLGTKRGLYYSIVIFLATFVIGIVYLHLLSSESIDSLGQYYFANLFYIIVLYYAQHVFKTYADLEMFKKHAYYDSLTRIANRLLIDEWLENKLKALENRKDSFSIIFFDIDHFKSVNDNYGHKIGDEVLVELAKLIQYHLTNRELFGRWGGEEFIIISSTSSTSGEDTVRLAEKLREVVANHDFKSTGNLTASFGVTQSRPGDSIDSLLNRADRGLYQCKNCGRNQVSYIN